MNRLLALLALSACSNIEAEKGCPEGSERRPDGLCYLLDTGEDTGTPDADGGSTDGDGDGGDEGDSAGDEGGEDGEDDGGDEGGDDGGGDEGGGDDPIRTTGSVASEPHDDALFEYVDAAMIDDDYAILAGFGGYIISDVRDGEPVAIERARRGLRVATDGDLAAIATRTEGLVLADVSDPTAPTTLGELPLDDLPGAHEDIAVDDGRILLGAHDRGGVLIDATGARLATIPADDAFAVALLGNRALITDGPSLELWDLSNLSAPALLTSAPLPGEGRDLAWEGEHVAVGMGGLGVVVFSLVDDALAEQGTLETPGSALSVDVDGDLLWIGAWEVAALADLGTSPPLMLGHETTTWSAMAIAGSGGRAVVADWFSSTALEASPDARGPEIVPSGDLYFSTDAPTAQLARFENAGPEPLNISFNVDTTRFSLDSSALTLDPDESALVAVTPTSSWSGDLTTLRWTSNDADEPNGEVRLAPVDQGVGSTHVDFTLPGYQLPDRNITSFSLADARGKVVVLVYWALF